MKRAMKIKVFLSLASLYASIQCVRPMFYEEPSYDLWWLALVFLSASIGFWVNRKTAL